MQVPERSEAAAAAMARVQAVLADPEQRKRFAKDPEATLSTAEVPIKDIPPPVLDVLRGLSDEELDLIGRLQTTLVENGLYIDVPGHGTVCFL